MFKLLAPYVLLSYSVCALFGAYDGIFTHQYKSTNGLKVQNASPDHSYNSGEKNEELLHKAGFQYIMDPRSEAVKDTTDPVSTESYEGTDTQLITSITDTITNCNLLTQSERQYGALLLDLEKQDTHLANVVNQAIKTLEDNLNNNLDKELENAYLSKSECETGNKFHDRLKKRLQDAIKIKKSNSCLTGFNDTFNDTHNTNTETNSLVNELINGIFNIIQQNINAYIIERTQLLLLKNHTFNMIVQELLYGLTCLKEIYTGQCYDDNLRSSALKAFNVLSNELSVNLKDLALTNYEWYTNMMTNRLELDIIEGVSDLINQPQITLNMVQAICILQNTMERVVQNFEKIIKDTKSAMPYHCMIDQIIGECVVKVNRYAANLLQDLRSNIKAQYPPSLKESERLREYKMICVSRLIDTAGLKFSLNTTSSCNKQTTPITSDSHATIRKIEDLVHEDTKASKQQMNAHQESLERMQKIIRGSPGNKMNAILDEIAGFREHTETARLVSFFERILDLLYRDKPKMSSSMWSHLRGLLFRHERRLFNKDICTFLPTIYSYIEYFIRGSRPRT